MSEENKKVENPEELPAPLLQFPCEFPMKIVGVKADDFAQQLVEVIQKFDPNFNAAEVNMKESAKGNYLSLGVVVNATSQEMLDNLYQALVDHKYTKFVL